MADVAAIHRRPFLIGLRHHCLPLGIQHEHPLWAVDQTAAAADAPLPLDPHHHAPLGINPDVVRIGPFFGAIERGVRRAVAFFDFLAQVIEREHRDVLDARLDIVDRRRRPRADPLLQQRLHQDFRGAGKNTREALFLGVGREHTRR